jgi:5-deoxy-D-glucuronate isomerase
VKTTSLIRAGEHTKYIWLDVTSADPGEAFAIGPGEERLVVILSGRASLTLDGQDAGAVGGRADVFEGPGDAVYVPPSSSVTLVADETPVASPSPSSPPR